MHVENIGCSHFFFTPFIIIFFLRGKPWMVQYFSDLYSILRVFVEHFSYQISARVAQTAFLEDWLLFQYFLPQVIRL
jgi:hypothetical protein